MYVAALSAVYRRARVILTPGHLFFEVKGSLSTTPNYTEGWGSVRYIHCDRGEGRGGEKRRERVERERD